MSETKTTHSLNVIADDNKAKDTDFKGLISSDIEEQSDKIEVYNTNATDILNELLSTIQKVDFLFLAYPEAKKVIARIEELEPLINNPDGSLNTDNKEEFEEYNALNKKLRSYRLTKNHFLVLVVEQLLKKAKSNNWGLCKKHDFIYLYNGEYWIEIDQEEFKFFLGEVALKMGVERIKGKIFTFKEELYKQFMSDAFLPTPKADDRKVLINLRNGTFEISPSKRILRDFKRADFITHQLPFKYDESATAPQFQKFLDEVIPDKDKQKILSEYLGYIFIRPSVLKLEKALVLYGSGANGKSVIFEIIEALLGFENMSNFSLSSLTNENGYYRAKIANKLVNYASEINGRLETSYFKQLASGEPIEARLPYGQPLTITEYAKLIFNSNELPHEVEHNHAFFRRFIIIHFDVTIPEEKQDKELPKKIVSSELSGVFNWILEGVERLLKQRRFSESKAVDDAISDFKKNSDSVKLFLDDNEYSVTSEDYTTIKDLYQQYRSYTIEDGYKSVNKSNFIKRLRHHKVLVERKSVGYVAYVYSDLISKPPF